MLRKTLKNVLILCILLGTFVTQAQTVTTNPTEYDGALANPLKGFRPSFRGTNAMNFEELKYPTLVRHYIYWNDLEDNAGDGVDKIIDFCNKAWAGAEDANIKIIPRVILQYGDGQYYWPSDLPEGDYADPRLKQRVRNMIEKLGRAWNNDPRVAWVQTGIIGKWGEQESPVGVDEDGWVKLLADEYLAHLPNKKLVVRNQNHWTDEGYDMMGAYWDSFGHTQQYNGSWTRVLNANKTNRYLVAPVEGEVAYNWGNEGLSNFCDISLPTQERNTSTVSTPKYYNFIINTTKQLHTSANGWISGYAKNSSTALGAELIQKAFGYRYVIDEFKVAGRTEPGSSLSFSAKITNEGSAPTYENWPVAFVLIDESTRQIVLQEEISGVNIRDWHPGSNYDWDPKSNANGSKVYLNQAKQNTVSGSVSIPAGFSKGEYLAGIAIIDPSTQKPGVFFAAENFFKESQAQPLSRIGIGVDASNNSLSGVSFDDPLDDDNRYYALTPPAPTYALTANAGTGGTISGAGGNITENSVVTVTAIPEDGFQFDSWSGDLTGSTNPTTIIMNSNKTISATFTAAAAEAFPWREEFNQANGSTSDESPTSWTTSGGLTVNNNRLSYNNARIEGVFTSGLIDISNGSVDVSLDVVSAGGLDIGQDYVRFYKKVDGGAETLMDVVDGFETTTLSGKGITGSTLQLVVRTFVTIGSEMYTLDNINVESSGTSNSTCDLPWTDSDFSVTKTTVDYSSGAIDISCASAVSISMNLKGEGPMENNDYCNVYYKVDGGSRQIISENVNAFGLKTVGIPDVRGNSIEIIINTYNSYGDETYTVSNLKITATGNDSKSTSSQNVLLNEVQIDKLVKVYPNPTSSSLNIDFPDAETTRDIQIFNTAGQLLYSTQTNNASTQLDLQSLGTKGIIMIEVRSIYGVSNHKVIIQ